MGHGEGPLYLRIARHFAREVEAGRLRAGAKLPPIRALARSLGVNRDTVWLAYEELASRGVVEATVGRGTFVRAAAPVDPQGRAASEALGLGPPAFQPRFSASVERVLAFERGRILFRPDADTIAFHSLVPDPSTYPVGAFRRALRRALSAGGAGMLRYGGPQGHRGLREVLSARLGQSAVEVRADDLVLCQGASQGITLALRLFAERGDAVALEEPTYQNVLAAISGLGLRTAPIPTGSQGPDLAELDRALARPEVKLLYTIPTFHNPLGTSTPLAHRRALLETASRHGKPVIEDAYETDLRFAGRALPPLAALDPSGVVLHLYSFSKSLFPGARVGAISARGRVVDALVAMRNATDLGGALLLQAALAELVASGDYDRHLARLRRILRSRRDALLDALEREMPEGVRWTTPEGGYQVWVELPEGFDTRELLEASRRAGVLFAPGSQFQHDGRASSGLRLCIAVPDESAIRRGVRTLAWLVRERLEAGPSEARAAAVDL